MQSRLPKYLGYFERVVESNAARGVPHAVGAALSYVDLSLFQIIAGLEYAFPRALSRVAAKTPRLLQLRDRVAAEPAVAAYLQSPTSHSVQPARHLPEATRSWTSEPAARRQAVQLTVYMCTWAGEPACVEVTVTWPPALIVARFAAVSVTACMCPNATLVSTI